MASQSFQLGNHSGNVAITLLSSADELGYLNISANSQERLVLPMGWPHSAILQHHESHNYFVGGSREVELIVRKCLECNLEVRIRPEGGETYTEALLERDLRIIVQSPEEQFFIDVTTNHYAFYTIIIKPKQSNTVSSSPQLANSRIRAYLT
jgi:hypothetical protein